MSLGRFRRDNFMENPNPNNIPLCPYLGSTSLARWTVTLLDAFGLNAFCTPPCFFVNFLFGLLSAQNELHKETRHVSLFPSLCCGCLLLPSPWLPCSFLDLSHLAGSWALRLEDKTKRLLIGTLFLALPSKSDQQVACER